MIMQDTLPGIKSFFRSSSLSDVHRGFVIRMMIGFMMHAGQMSASQAAGAVRTESRHRAAVTRFLSRSRLGNSGEVYQALTDALLAMEKRRTGTWLLIVDKTCCSRQGTKTENTFSTGNRQRRPQKGRRYNKKKNASKRCHGFVMGLLITPSGYRIPFHRCYYTRDYCEQQQKKKRKRQTQRQRKNGHRQSPVYRTEAELGAEIIRTVPVPEDADVVVLGDTAYEAASVREACEAREFSWITPVNPERVIEGEKPRPKVRSRISDLKARQFSPVRLTPGRGQFVAQRRVAACRIGPRAKTRTFYAHKERLAVHSVGKVQVVFSTKDKPQNGKPPKLDKTKILMTNDLTLPLEKIVEIYDLRWQIELFFKELKSTLGLGHYGFRRFEAVESWVESCLIAYLYLEWRRGRQLARRDLSPEGRRWWSWQRTHGLCQAIAQEAESRELNKMADWSLTRTGLKKLKRQVRAARPQEYQIKT